MRLHPDRFIFGSDAVKPESNAQYFRHHHDLEPIFMRIRDEVGADALANVRYRVLEMRLADAQRDVQQWVFNEMSDPTSRRQWNALFDELGLTEQRRQIARDWFEAQPLTPTAAGVGPDYLLPDGTAVNGSPMLLGTRNRQVQSLIRWHNAVTPRVVAGRRLSVRLIVAALRASWFDHQNAHEDRRAARTARKHARRFELDAATHTGELGLLDAAGDPYTVQAVISAGQTGHATTPDWARRVLELTQDSELRRLDDTVERGRTRNRLLLHTAIAAGVFTAVVAVTGWTMWPLLTTTTAGYVAFAVRGALNLQRGVYSQQMRVLVESILERGQFNDGTIRLLSKTMRTYAFFDRATGQQLDDFGLQVQKAMARVVVLKQLLLAPDAGETARMRYETALQDFSKYLDKAGNALGAQAQSFHGLNPHGGVLGRLLNTALALTFVVNAFGHFHGLLTTDGFVMAVNGAFLLADLLFLGQAAPSAITGWAGWDVGAHPLIRKLVHRFALPVITFANAMLTAQLAFIDSSPMVIPAIALTLSSGYLTILGLISEGKLGRLAPRRGALANGVLNASLMAFGVLTLLPDHWWQLIMAAGLGPVVLYAVSRLDLWLSRRTRAPPPDQLRLAAMTDEISGVRGRLDRTPQFRWDALRIRERNRLLHELDQAQSLVSELRRESWTGPVPNHRLVRAERRVVAVVVELDTLIGNASGGLVVVGPPEPALRAMAGAADALARAATPLDASRNPGGPQVPVLLVPAHLRPKGAEGVVAFGHRRRGAVLIFEDTFAEITEHIGAWRLGVEWWTRLLEHERDFHLVGQEDTGHRHDQDAAPIAAELAAARSAGLGRLTPEEAGLVAAALQELWETGPHGGHVVSAFGLMPFASDVSPRSGQAVLLLPRHVLRDELVAQSGDPREAADIVRRLVRFGWADRFGQQLVVVLEPVARELERYGLLRSALDAADGTGPPGYDELLRRFAEARAARPDAAAAFHALAQAQDAAAGALTTRGEAYLTAADEWVAPLADAARQADTTDLAVQIATRHPALLRWAAFAPALRAMRRADPEWYADLETLALLADPDAVPTEGTHADVVALRSALAGLSAATEQDVAELRAAHEALGDAMTGLWLATIDGPEQEQDAVTAIRRAVRQQLAASRAGDLPFELVQLGHQLLQPWMRVLSAYGDVSLLQLGAPGGRADLVGAYVELDRALRDAFADPGPLPDLEPARRLHVLVQARLRAWAAGERLAAVLDAADERWARELDELRDALRTARQSTAARLWRADTVVATLTTLEALLWNDVDLDVLITQAGDAHREAALGLLAVGHHPTPHELAERLVELAELERQISVLRLAARALDPEAAFESNLARLRGILLEAGTEVHELLTGAGVELAGVLPMPGDEVRARLAGYTGAVADAERAYEDAVAALDRAEDALRELDGGSTTEDAGGLVAVGPPGPARRAMSNAAERLHGSGTPLDPERYPGRPRGPPVPVRLVPARLRPAGAEGVIAFGHQRRGEVLIFEDVFAEILEHIAAGRLTVDWWNRLLEHERDFHLLGAEHTGQRHDEHATPIAGAVLVARARAHAGAPDTTVTGVPGPRLVVAAVRPGSAALPEEQYGEVWFAGVPYTAFTGQEIGVLAEAMAALAVGGVLVIQTGERVAPHLPEITDALRRLGGGFVETITQPRRIIVVKSAPTDPAARHTGPVPSTEDEPTRTRLTRPAVRPFAVDERRRATAARLLQAIGRSGRDWAPPHWLRDELGIEDGALLAAAGSSPYLLLVPAELGGTDIVAVDRDAVDAGFRGTLVDDRPALELPGPAGRLLVDGRQIEATAEGWGKTNLGHFVDRLTAQMATWLITDGANEVRARALAQLAETWSAGTGPVARSGELTLRRIDRGAPVARLADGTTTGVLDVLTLRLGAGRELLLEVSPVAAGADHGPAFTAGYPEGSIVHVGTDRGTTIGTGVVVRAAAPGRPAHVLTALHVVQAYQQHHAGRSRLVVNGSRVGGWTTLALAQYGTDQDRAAAAVARFGHHAGVGTVDLALLAVDGLEAPAVPVRPTAVRPGERVAISGFPQAHELTTQGRVTATPAGHLAAAVLLGKGVSGGPAFDANHHLAGIASFRPMDDSRLHLVGPALIAAFLSRAGPVLDGLGSSGGGLVALGPQEPARAAMLGSAGRLHAVSVVLDRQRFRHLPRGPPGVDVRVVAANDRPAGAEGVIAFGWGQRRVVLIFEDTVAEADAHIAAGRLPASWWLRLLAHERDFHVAGDRHTGLRHALDAGRLGARLLWARAGAWWALVRAAGSPAALWSARGRLAAAEALTGWVRQAPSAPDHLRYRWLAEARLLVSPLLAKVIAGGDAFDVARLARLHDVLAGIDELRPRYGDGTARWSWLPAVFRPVLGPGVFAGLGVAAGASLATAGAGTVVAGFAAGVAVSAVALRRVATASGSASRRLPALLAAAGSARGRSVLLRVAVAAGGVAIGAAAGVAALTAAGGLAMVLPPMGMPSGAPGSGDDGRRGEVLPEAGPEAGVLVPVPGVRVRSSSPQEHDFHLAGDRHTGLRGGLHSARLIARLLSARFFAPFGLRDAAGRWLAALGIAAVIGLTTPSGAEAHPAPRAIPVASAPVVAGPAVVEQVQLHLPPARAPVGSGREVWTQPGDTVARLADGLGTSAAAVRAALQAAPRDEPLPASDNAPLRANLPFTAPEGTGATWKTQPERFAEWDSLSRIASRFGLHDWTDVADANREVLARRDPDLIHPDEIFTVPGKPAARPTEPQPTEPQPTQPEPTQPRPTEPSPSATPERTPTAPPATPGPGRTGPSGVLVAWLAAAGVLLAALGWWR
ncbi:trypsin-like peptidase domain-containing protein, partial [Pseudonocardia zijingensis]|uniref:trypsin-like peptidase domain-containing protein n=1 Tax=Pseudonocardia zijingensis TaxID=153376 RepID=UPI0031D211DB